MANEWTTEYPTQPGYYWLRNAVWKTAQHNAPVPDVVEVRPSLSFYFAGDDWFNSECDIVSAEWFGPIRPPLEPSLCMVGGHPPDCQGHIQQPQENDK